MQKRGSLWNYLGVCCATIFSVLVPTLVHASVTISEVMYDPAGSDTNQEWIELYNSGDTSVDIAKWSFSDGSSATKHGLNAPPKNGGVGTTVIPAGGYVIIADDATTFVSAFPSVSPVLDSTMSLPDPKAGVAVTVTLYDADKTLTDSFVYVGGSNADNKGDSVQRSAAGIIPALPTPGVANAQTADTTDTTSTDTQTTTDTGSTTQTQTTIQSAAVSSYVAPPVQTLFADAGADRIEVVGADTEFHGRAYARNQTLVDNVRYSWNFGDGTTAEGETVLHHYSFPGKYAVTLSVAQDKNSGSDRVVVTAEPAHVGFASYPDGSVAITNMAGRELDLSHWLVKSGVRQFMLPSESVLLPGASMRIAQATLGFWSQGDAELAYPNGVRALSAGESSTATTAAEPAPVAEGPVAPVPIVAPAPKATTVHALESAPAQSEPETESLDDVPTTTSAQTAAVGSVFPTGSPWMFAALGLAGLGGAAAYVSRSLKKDEWEIEDIGASV